jgi:hypothetical protein
MGWGWNPKWLFASWGVSQGWRIDVVSFASWFSSLSLCLWSSRVWSGHGSVFGEGLMIRYILRISFHFLSSVRPAIPKGLFQSWVSHCHVLTTVHCDRNIDRSPWNWSKTPAEISLTFSLITVSIEIKQYIEYVPSPFLPSWTLVSLCVGEQTFLRIDKIGTSKTHISRCFDVACCCPVWFGKEEGRNFPRT